MLIKDAWVELGQPLTAHGSTGQLIAHPLLKAMNEVESLADRLRQTVLKRHRGPSPRAVVGPSPAARLRDRNGR